MAVTIPDCELTVVEVGDVDNVGAWVQLDLTQDVEYARTLIAQCTDDWEYAIAIDSLLDGEEHDDSNKGAPVSANTRVEIPVPHGAGKIFVTCAVGDAELFATVTRQRYR